MRHGPHGSIHRAALWGRSPGVPQGGPPQPARKARNHPKGEDSSSAAAASGLRLGDDGLGGAICCTESATACLSGGGMSSSSGGVGQLGGSEAAHANGELPQLEAVGLVSALV